MSKSAEEMNTDKSTEEESRSELTPSGYLTPGARAAASRYALPLVSRYFMSNNTDMIPVGVFSTMVSSEDPLLDMPGLHLRLALARVTELVIILENIRERPSFRYELAKEISIGVLSGQLNLNEYALRGGQVVETTAYPIVAVRRGSATPENILATYAAKWALGYLKVSKALAQVPSTGPEANQVLRLSVKLRRFLELPISQACATASSRLRTTSQLRKLQNQVKIRVRRREVLAPDSYRRLLTWTENFVLGVSNSEGNEQWLHYGQEFDTRLFELWCVHLLAQSIADSAYLPLPEIRADWRKDGLVFRWQRAGGLIEIFYQRSIQSITNNSIQPRWKRKKGGRRDLGGIPDIVIRTISQTGQQRLAVVDPKLRQRSSTPTEELYKILGYIENYDQSTTALGAILFHDPHDETQLHEFEAGAKQGHLFALPLNPLDETKSLENIGHLTDVILREIGATLRPKSNERTTDLDSQELSVTEARLHELRCVQGAMGSLLDPSRDRVEMALGNRTWSRLDQETQNMLATAEHVGFTLGPDADYSAGTIGFCVALERLIFKELIEPIISENPDLHKGPIMLGTAIFAISHGLQEKGTPLAREVGRRIRELEMDEVELAALSSDKGGPLWTVNKDFRVPAAHRSFMTRNQWRMGWQHVIGDGQILRRLSAALEIRLDTKEHGRRT